VKSKNSSEAPVISIVKLLHGDRYPSPRAIDRPPRAPIQRWPKRISFGIGNKRRQIAFTEIVRDLPTHSRSRSMVETQKPTETLATLHRDLATIS
jgi:hypothetical protein